MSIFTLLKVTKICSVLPLRLIMSDFWNIFIRRTQRLWIGITKSASITNFKTYCCKKYWFILISSFFVIHNFSFHESPIFFYTKLYVFFIPILEEYRILGYFGYLDDILNICDEKSADIKDRLSEFSSLPNLKFTSEVEINGKINFLDITIMKSQHTVDTSIYWKPTTTDCIMPYASFQPIQYSFCNQIPNKQNVGLSDSKQ